MDEADEAIFFYKPDLLKKKKIPPITKEEVFTAFARQDLKVMTTSDELYNYLKSRNYKEKNLLIMTSGNFSGLDIKLLAEELINK